MHNAEELSRMDPDDAYRIVRDEMTPAERRALWEELDDLRFVDLRADLNIRETTENLNANVHEES
jgi:hypothetical protein